MRVDGLFAVRAVVFQPRTREAIEAAAEAGLAAWLGSSPGTRVRLSLVEQARLGLLVQRLGEETPLLIWEPRLRIDSVTGRILCRYHEGPRGEPWRHRYCSNIAVTRDGYCRLHASSWKALYERCAQGSDEACRRAADMLRGESFAVYVLDYGGDRVKVGMTQAWRLLWRVAEQPHAAAAVAASGLGLLEARGLEKRLGSMKRATQGAGARLEERLRLAARLLERTRPQGLASRLASRLAGLGLRGVFEAYTVLPRGAGAGWFADAPRARGLEEVAGRGWLSLEGHWAGLLMLGGPGGGHVVLEKRLLLHRVVRGAVSGAPEP